MVQSSSLVYTGHFASSGGSLVLTGTTNEANAAADVIATIPASTTFYASSIMTMNTVGNYHSDWALEQRFNTAANGNYASSSGRNEVSAYGSGSGITRRAGVSSDADEVTVSGAVAGTKYLLVTAYTSNVTDVTQATLYGFDLTSYATYLTNSNAENAAANLGTYATFTATDTDNRALSDFNYLQYSVYSGGSNSGNPTGQMDDFRLGTQITDVVNVVPESGSALLGSLGVLALLRRRRQIQPHLVNPHFPALRPGLDRRSVAETPPMALSGASRRKQIPSSLIFQSKKTTKQHMKNRSILTLVSFVSGLALPMHAATIVDNATSIAAPLTSTTNISAITDSFQNTDDKFFRRNSAASVGTLTYQPVSEEITNVTVRLYLHDSIYNDGGFNTAKFNGTILGFTNGANNSSITVGSFNDANIATNSGWRIYDVTSSGIFSTPTLIVTLGNPFNSSDTWRSNIDTVTLTTVAVPEPSGFALLLGSVGAISLLRRRR